MTSLTRRQALVAAASTTALTACTMRTPTVVASASSGPRIDERQATALLDSVAANLLALSPESATSLGIDKGANVALRSKLSDRSPEGQARLAAVIRSDLARVSAVDLSALTPSSRTSIEVVRSAYSAASQGFAQPYGDV